MNSCTNCVYFDICEFPLSCLDFCPTEDQEDEYIDRIIETRRREYTEAWFEYVDEDRL